eukprot:gene10639-14278_t
MTLPNYATWFITGCSTGFGRIFAERALRRGDNGVATARSLESLDDLRAGYPDRLLKLKLDVTDSRRIAVAVKAAKS